MDRRDFIEKSALAAGGALLAGTGVEALANDNKGKTMKVLMINGSPHQKGNTAVALDEIAKQLKVNGIDSEIVWIGNKAVRGCIACGGCSRNPGKCVFDDDICNRISEKFAEADALIVGSPVYYGQPNGAVLSVIQRAFYSNGHPFCFFWLHDGHYLWKTLEFLVMLSSPEVPLRQTSSGDRAVCSLRA